MKNTIPQVKYLFLKNIAECIQTSVILGGWKRWRGERSSPSVSNATVRTWVIGFYTEECRHPVLLLHEGSFQTWNEVSSTGYCPSGGNNFSKWFITVRVVSVRTFSCTRPCAGYYKHVYVMFECTKRNAQLNYFIKRWNVVWLLATCFVGFP